MVKWRVRNVFCIWPLWWLNHFIMCLLGCRWINYNFVFFFILCLFLKWSFYACNHHWLIFITLPGPSLTILLCLTWITSLQDKILYFGYYWTLGFLFVLLRSWLSRNWILKIYFFKSFRSLLFYNFRSHPKFFLHGSKMTLFKKELIILFILFFSL